MHDVGPVHAPCFYAEIGQIGACRAEEPAGLLPRGLVEGRRLFREAVNAAVDVGGVVLVSVDDRFDDLPRVPLALRPFARFRSRDHLGDPASPIRANVDGYLARRGISLAGGRVLMLGHAAVLGYVFNPVSFFLDYDARGNLVGIDIDNASSMVQRKELILSKLPGKVRTVAA